jgi:hypothetical protein
MIKMGRPRLDSEPLEKLSLMVPHALMQAIAAYTEEQQRSQPLRKLTRSDVCRDILADVLTQWQERKPARRQGKKGDDHAA